MSEEYNPIAETENAIDKLILRATRLCQDYRLNRDCLKVAGKHALLLYGLYPSFAPYADNVAMTMYFDIENTRSGRTEMFTDGSMWVGMNLQEGELAYPTAMRIDSVRKINLIGDPLPVEEDPHEVYNMAVLPIERLLLATNLNAYEKRELKQLKRRQEKLGRPLSWHESAFLHQCSLIDPFIENQDDPTLHRANRVIQDYCETIASKAKGYRDLWENFKRDPN